MKPAAAGLNARRQRAASSPTVQLPSCLAVVQLSSCPAVQLAASSGARWCLMLGRGWASLRKTLNFLKAEYEFAGSVALRFVLPLIHSIPDSLTYPVPLYLKR